MGVLLLGLLVTGIAMRWESRRVHTEDQDRFGRLHDRVVADLQRRTLAFHYGLMGSRSVFPAGRNVDRDTFRAMVTTTRLNETFPGALGIGFIRRVPNTPAAIDAFIHDARLELGPDFQIKTLPDAAALPDAATDDLMIIKYLEPQKDNQQALGLDIGGHPARRDAAERAMLTGMGQITSVVQLVQDEQQLPGFVYMLPVYAEAAPLDTREQRIDAMVGWIFMPMLAPEVFRGLAQTADNELDVRIFDGTRPTPASLIYDADGDMDHAKPPNHDGSAIHTSTYLAVGGRVWTVDVRASEHFQLASRAPMVMLGVGGAFIASLLTVLVYLQSTAVWRARSLAVAMTDELRRLAMVAEYTTNAVLITDLTGAIIWANNGYTKLTGRTMEQVCGKTATSVMRCDRTDPTTVKSIENRGI